MYVSKGLRNAAAYKLHTKFTFVCTYFVHVLYLHKNAYLLPHNAWYVLLGYLLYIGTNHQESFKPVVGDNVCYVRDTMEFLKFV